MIITDRPGDARRGLGLRDLREALRGRRAGGRRRGARQRRVCGAELMTPGGTRGGGCQFSRGHTGPGWKYERWKDER